MSDTGLRKHSVSIRGHATSYTLEDEFFQIVGQIAEARGQSVASLIAEVDSKRGGTTNLSSALRLYVLNWLKEQIPADH